MGKILIFLGFLLVIAGILVLAGFPLGRLPGDISYKGERFRFYLPLATSLIISIALSIGLYLYSKYYH